MPYFTSIWKLWYQKVNGKTVKGLPANIAETLTPLAIAHWIIGALEVVLTGLDEV
jgi:hypothetical protein